MDQHKPLSYESLKTVIQYRDANFRLVRSRQISSLRNIQKVVPLRLDVLELNYSKFTFDNIEYSYDHCRKYTEDGGRVIVLYTKFDLNDDGENEIFQDLMPGDVVIKDRDWRTSFAPGNRHFLKDSYVCRVRTLLNNECLKSQTYHRMKIRDMMRKTLNQVLGGKGIHQIEHLKIAVYHGVLRLPEGLKLKIRKLSIEDNSKAVIDAILPILDVSSFPLKSLSIMLNKPQDPVIKSEILKASEFLIIKNRGAFNNCWANLLIDLPNMKIHLKNRIPSNDIVLLVRNWMEHPRVIGTRLSMQAISVEEYLNEIEKEFKPAIGVLPEKKCTSFSSCFTLPMTSTSELIIHGAKSPNYEEMVKKGMAQIYMVVIKIMPIGTAKPLKDQ